MWHSQIEELTTVSGHLSYVKKLINREDLNTQSQKLFLSKIGAIESRLLDNKLYVAIVGRAATGKSTFINALIREELLEKGILYQTTSAATIITYGNEIKLQIKFKNEESFRILKISASTGIVFSNDEYGNFIVEISLKAEPIQFHARKVGLKELMRIITTMDEIVEQILELNIFYPSPFLKQGITIIDTPGADANIKEHVDITRGAVEKADAAIIITPGEQPVSRWLLNILKDPDFLRPLLHRCVYMITLMDKVTVSARKQNFMEVKQMIEGNAKARLKENLEKINYSKSPIVYSSAAQVVLDQVNNEESIVKTQAEKEYWLNEFFKFEKEFKDYLIYQRAETISGSVLRLLTELFNSLDGQLSILWSEYTSRTAKLDNIVNDLSTFCDEEKAKWKKEIRRAKRNVIDEVEIAVSRERDNCLNEVRSNIFDAGSLDEIKYYIESNLKSRLEDAISNIESSIEKANGKISRKAIAFNDSFENQFNVFYEKLKLLAQNDRLDARRNFSLDQSKNNIAVSSDGAVEDFSVGNLLGGAAIGFLIGSFIPFIGNIFGAIVGGIIGSFWGPSLDDRKASIWDELKPKLITFFDKNKEESKKLTEGIIKKVKKKVEKRIDKYIEIYGSEVSQMRSNQQKEKLHLEKLQASLKTDLKELKLRQLQLKEQQENLHLNLNIS